jgi:CBS domain-containing protein
MEVRDGMSRIVLQVGPGHTLREASRQMSERKVGAAVVHDPDAPGPGIITERDILNAIGAGVDPDAAMVESHTTGRGLVFAAPHWSLEEAAAAMVKGAFRHLIVVDEGKIVGILAMRDIVRCWTDDGAICEVPASAALSG